MDLREIYSYNCGNNGKFPRISFEAVVPENGDVAELFEKLRAVKKYNPVLISLSIGANTQMQGLPIEFLQMVLDLELNVLPNISISNLSKELVEHYIMRIENLGIENILVTEGIPSVDFENACALVDFIHQKSTLSIGVKENIENISGIVNLNKKIEAGASVIFTEKCFDNKKLFSYIDLIRKIGVKVPVVAGINSDLAQCKDLLESGIYGLHFNNIDENLDFIKEITKGVNYGKLK